MSLEALKFVPDYRILFKPVKHCTTDGCHMDVWIPKEPGGQACSLAIMIHGGGFSHGSSGDISVNQAQWFLEHGVAVVSLEYRLAPHVQMLEIREDIFDAYIYIQHHLNAKIRAEDASASTIDTTRCIVTGGSAGGTGALYLAADIETYNLASSSPLPSLRAVLTGYPMVACDKHFNAPQSSLTKMVQDQPDGGQAVLKIFKEPVCCSDPYEDMVTRDSTVVRRQPWMLAVLASNSLSSFLFGDPPYPSDADIRNLLTPSYPPTWIYCALDDDLIPVEQSLMLKVALDGLGVECKADEVHAPHGFMDLPPRYFPDRAQDWWTASIEPSLKWAVGKLDA